MKKYLSLLNFLVAGVILATLLVSPVQSNAQENESPHAYCRDITVYLDNYGEQFIWPEDIDDGSYDWEDGPAVILNIDRNLVNCADVGVSVPITLTVTDSDGASSQCTAYVTVVDDTPPQPRCVGSFTVFLDGSGEASITVADINDGSTDNCGIGPMSLSADHFDCEDLGWNDVYLDVYDINGHIETCMSTVFVEDWLPPVAMCRDATVYIDNWGQATVEPYDIDNGSYDNCGIDWVSLDTYHFSCFDIGEDVEVTLTVEDYEGNEGHCTAQVTVVDDTPPEIECSSTGLNLDENGEAVLDIDDLVDWASDNCFGVDVTISPNKTLFDCDDLGSNPVTLIATDDFGNSSTCPTSVYVIDSQPPMVTCAPDMEFPTDPGECGAWLYAEITPPTVNENCSFTLTNDAPAYFPLGSTYIEWTAEDDSHNFSRCIQEITIVDEEPPVLTGCPADVTVHCMTDVPAAAVVTAEDNCSGVIPVSMIEFQTDPTDFCLNIITRTWSARDFSDNEASCTQTITVRDDVPPMIICAPGAVRSSDPGECTYTVVGSEFDATATDNCEGISQINWSLSGATEGAGMSSLGGMDLNFGKTTVIWTAWDKCGNASTCQMVIDVNKIITITEVTVDPTEAQEYSDPVTFTATIQPGACVGAGQAATHVIFYVNNQPMGEPVPLELVGGLLVGTAIYPLLETAGYEGSLDPDPALNPKLVKASFIGVDPDFEVLNPATKLTVLPEDACAYYAGVYYASTGSAISQEATVVLAVTIVEEDDGHPGDFLNKAFVQFYADGSLIATVPVKLPVDEIGSGPAIGTASFEWTEVPTGVYEITVKVLGYYENPDPGCDGYALVTVGQPTPDFITGGGYVTLENSMGLIAGTPGTKNNFGFVVKYNRRMTNIQGNLNTMIRRDETDGLHFYKVKSTALTSLAINSNKATFTGKASIQDLNHPQNNGMFTGNNLLQFTLTDNGEPGTSDLISITVWKNDGGLWFTTLWDAVAYRPAEQLLDGGNLVVHSAADDGGGGTRPPKKKVAFINTPASLDEALQVYPNPFTNRVNFDLTLRQDADARLEIFDITGAKLQTVYEGKVFNGQLLHLEYLPGRTSHKNGYLPAVGQ